MKTFSMSQFLETNIRIVNRTVNPLWLLIIAVVSQLALHLVGNSLVPQLNFPLLTVIICYFAVAFIFDDFLIGGKNETVLYKVVPVNLNHIVLAKNVTAMLAFTAVFIPALLIESISFGASGGSITRACLYVLTSIFSVLLFGNLLSVRYGRAGSRNRTPMLPVIEAAILLVASLPYWLFSALSYGILYCVLYSSFVAVSWYFLSIPLTARLLRETNDDSHYDE